jgi:hypothetical protein
VNTVCVRFEVVATKKSIQSSACFCYSLVCLPDLLFDSQNVGRTSVNSYQTIRFQIPEDSTLLKNESSHSTRGGVSLDHLSD